MTAHPSPTSGLPAGQGHARVLLLERDAATFARLAAPVACDPALELVTASSEAAGLFALVAQVQPEVALVNSRIEKSGSADVVRKLRDACPRIRCIALSSGDDEAELADMLAAGAVGWVDAQATGRTIASAVYEFGGLRRCLNRNLTVSVLGQHSELVKARAADVWLRRTEASALGACPPDEPRDRGAGRTERSL